MPPLFDHLDSVERLLPLSPLGLITDIDGTISRTARTPSEAQISPMCRNYLALLAKYLKLVAAISGRPISQMRHMIGLDEIVYVGNHGFERWVKGESTICDEAGRYPALIEATLEYLKPLLPIEGIFLEYKGATASIHYRLCQDQAGTRERILTALATYPEAKDLIVRQGRRTIEILPPVEVNKGSGIRALIREYHLRSAIYMGDDLTDLDAFRAIHESIAPDFNGIGLAVLSKETAPEVEEGADFTFNSVDEVERFIEWLAHTVQSKLL